MSSDGCDPLTPVSALVGAARRYARGESSAEDRVGEVVVTIEEARQMGSELGPAGWFSA